MPHPAQHPLPGHRAAPAGGLPARSGLGLLPWQPWLGLAAIALGGAWLSNTITGQVFGVNNNVFHLPIVAGLPADPGFAGDAFVQSLRRFSSGVWLLLAGSDAWWPAPQLFGWLLLLSKALSILGLVLVAGALGLHGLSARAGLAAMLACAPLLSGTAYAGHGGLFLNYFSHSELANGATLLFWWACLRKRFDVALALNGLVFFLNAFMAVWNLLPWLWLAALAWQVDRSLLRRQAAGLAVAALAALALALPVLARAVNSGLLGGGVAAPAGFDQRQFLLDHYPYHVMASAMPPAQWLGVAVVAAVAVLALRRLGPLARPLLHLVAAYGVVYAIGMVLPLLTASASLLNLHLLRVSVHFHFLAAIALAVLAVQAWRSGMPAQRWLLAPLLACSLLAPRPCLLLALIALLVPVSVWQRLRMAPGPLVGVGLSLAAAALAGQAWLLHAQQQRTGALRASVADWSSIARAVGQSTPPGSWVLLPLDTSQWQPADAGSAVFEYTARRPVWADRKRGAAVLWQPDFHTEWQARTADLARLNGWPDRLRYAAGHGIAVVVDDCGGLPPATVPLARAGRLCAVQVAAAATPPAAQP